MPSSLLAALAAEGLGPPFAVGNELSSHPNLSPRGACMQLSWAHCLPSMDKVHSSTSRTAVVNPVNSVTII